ncbi:hypothetical protein EXU57_23185 [Segetibacter sp. 3557_3]|uniref:hypothetical protein n=1 Tax=Segetibacter sp. 3557_3 TaxID=2547429 RepID=UPI001058FA89|nr:hypothetical protein [Segetibacter sp. 3557_3]TDH18504.1 hypothetical protein EXU57_23185 [Segetibacter sp. 3557_3]
MSKKSPHRAPNIPDGTKLNAAHITGTANHEEYCRSQVMESYLNIYNYGLMAGDAVGSNHIVCTLDNQHQVHVRLQNFRAITLGGHIIELDSSENEDGDNFTAVLPVLGTSGQTANEIPTEYFLVVVINPYDRVPYGDIDPDVFPLHHPYVMPKCSYQLMPVNEARESALGKFHIPIGKLKIKGLRAAWDEAYIPPCCDSRSHQDLHEICANIEHFLGEIQRHCVNIIQKVLALKSQNELTIVTQKLCEQLAVFTAINLSGFKNLALYQPPVFIRNMVSSLASLTKNTLDSHTGCGKEAFLNYCSEFYNPGQDDLQSSLVSIATIRYNHLNIQDCFFKISNFLQAFEKLLKLLYDQDLKLPSTNRYYVSDTIVPGSPSQEKVSQPETQSVSKGKAGYYVG